MTDQTDVYALAQEIRRVDGNHKLGAAELAEALMPFIRTRLIAELGQEVGAADWSEWFETWAKSRGMTMQLTADGRFLCPDTALAQGAHEAGCMASHMYYMELCRQEELAKASPAHTSEARELTDAMVEAALDAQPFTADNVSHRVWQLVSQALTDEERRTMMRAALDAAIRREGGNG